jgi:hypothetical protein
MLKGFWQIYNPNVNTIVKIECDRETADISRLEGLIRPPVKGYSQQAIQPQFFTGNLVLTVPDFVGIFR